MLVYCINSKTSSGRNHWRPADVRHLFWCWKWDPFWRRYLWRLQSKVFVQIVLFDDDLCMNVHIMYLSVAKFKTKCSAWYMINHRFVTAVYAVTHSYHWTQRLDFLQIDHFYNRLFFFIKHAINLPHLLLTRSLSTLCRYCNDTGRRFWV